MPFSYQFSNLCGTVYKRGNLLFTPDGNALLSPVGNRVTLFELVQNKTTTLNFENRTNIDCIALSPNGALLVSVDEDGRALLVNMFRRVVLHHFNFKERVDHLCFSPDGRYLAVTHGKLVQVWQAPGLHHEFAPFVLYRTYGGHHADVTRIEWSADSQYFLATSKDLTCRLYSLDPEVGFSPFTFTGHKDYVLGAFFSRDGREVYTVSRDGGVFVWRPVVHRPKRAHQDEEDEQEDETIVAKDDDEEKRQRRPAGPYAYTTWSLAQRHFVNQPFARVVSVDFHRPSGVLALGLSTGVFCLYELPDFAGVHTLSVSQHAVSSVSFNADGQWLALGVRGAGQLIVWEWQSESYVFRQQGHLNSPPTCLAYSTDGAHIATGGADAKVKIWSTRDGSALVTWSEHTAEVTDLAFAKGGQVLFSSSLDGTVRAYDLVRYRNFRTFVAPTPVQFNCVAVDQSGEIVCAASRDTFEVCVWNVQNGRLLDVLSGHEGPIVSIAFSPAEPNMIATGSWDKTVRFWDVFAGVRSKDVLQHSADVLAVAYRPDGLQLAAAALDGTITLWDPRTGQQTGTIEGRKDISGGRSAADRVTAGNNPATKYFTSLCYSADGRCLLASGSSRFVCIYDTQTQGLLRKYQLSKNRSLDGVVDQLNSKQLTDAGPLELIDDDDDSEAEEEARIRRNKSLPGAQGADFSSRRVRPAVRSYGVRFSPTNRSFAAATTEGLLIYSMDHEMVFDPTDLDLDVTPDNVRLLLRQRDWLRALVMSMRLNEETLIASAFEATPIDAIDLVARAFPEVYLARLVAFMAGRIDSSPHLEYYLTWARALLRRHAERLRTASAAVPDILPALRALHRSILASTETLTKVSDENRYLLDYLLLSSRRPAAGDAALLQNGAEDDRDDSDDASEGDDAEEMEDDTEEGDDGDME